MSDDILERRYRSLLRVYPARYRQERGEELLDTLLTSDAGRRWPTARQVAGLLRGALRVRAGGAGDNPAAVVRWQGLQLTAVAVMAYGAAHAASEVWPLWAAHEQVPWRLTDTVTAGLMVVTLLLLTLGFARLALAVGSLAVIVPLAATPGSPLDQTGSAVWWSAVLAVPLIAAGLRRPSAVPSLNWTARGLTTTAISAIVLATPTGLVMPFGRELPTAVVLGGAALGLLALFWFGGADPRLLMAGAGLFGVKALMGLCSAAVYAAINSTSPSWEALPQVTVYAAIVAALVTFTTVQTRRLAQI
jgi:hypothetical protein